MAEEGVSTADEFSWQSRLRYYFEHDALLVRMLNAECVYGYEYLGCSSRLVGMVAGLLCKMLAAMHLHFCHANTSCIRNDFFLCCCTDEFAVAICAKLGSCLTGHYTLDRSVLPHPAWGSYIEPRRSSCGPCGHRWVG
jgi:hypothetical protein